ncbi:tyrosine protein kinase [Paenibacillus xylanexedens]|uniref:tyrosine protein kinase n=1 Tax=Paenibacillus xylanexedens TaxID=528191 RepID=UPI0021B4F6A8|nr:tyrosine protein kinase [Paenibacillus xylanexedens]
MPQHYYHRQPTPRQRPSSHPHRQRQAYTSAYAPPGVIQRSLNEAPVQSMYPGVEPYYPNFAEVEASGLVPYGQGAPAPNFYAGGAPVSAPIPVQEPASSGSSGFSLANIGELKGMIDRFGGIDGIMSGIGKMQKVVGGIQQMAPMMKLVMGILPFGKGKNNNSEADADYEEYSSPRPRKRRKKSTTTPRRRSNTVKRKASSTKRRPKSSKR